jgi:uncharacterized protein (TIGR02444 family)
MANSASPFWTFSLALYRTPGVPDACLQAQDDCGADVNVLLFALWLAHEGRRVGPDDLRDADAAVALWREEVVRSLRRARRALRTPPAGFAAEGAGLLRDAVKKVELESERLQQEALFALRPAAQWGAPADPAEAAPRNMEACEALLGASFAPAARAALLSAFAALQARGREPRGN